jgi:CRP-like cAMP-binding protein/CheY-like chemotaxis protein
VKKILVIEDNGDVRENIAEILTLSKYEVLVAANGKEGVGLAQKEHPDLIICDIMMPVLDGYGVLHLLSKEDSTAGIPFIFLTAKSERSDMRKGMEMGADDYLTKPFSDIELLNAIESRLKKTQQIKKEFTKNADGLSEFLHSARNFEDLKKLTEVADIEKYRKKSEVYSEGNIPKGLYFINKGKVKTYRTNEQGKEIITGLYKEGDFFGYLALVEETRYSDSAAALEDSEICMISKDDFFTLLYGNAEVSRKFIKILSDNLHEREEQMLKLAYNSVRKRIAESLVTMYKRYKEENEALFTMKIPREDLASLAGTSTETTIRTLSDFKDEGLIDMKGSMITVLKYEKLVKMRN